MDNCITQTNSHHHHHHHIQVIIRKTLVLVQFLVPLSIFTLLLSYFSDSINININQSLFFILFTNLHHNLSLFSLSDRNCMFLICNGILVLIAKRLRLDGASPDNAEITEMPQTLLSKDHDMSESCVVVHDMINNVVAVSEERRIPIILGQENANEDDDDGELSSVANREEGDEEERIIRACLAPESDEEDGEEEEEEETEIGVSVNKEEVMSDAQVSTEELNKKFEEFIRRMKEEIRIEARDSMIAV